MDGDGVVPNLLRGAGLRRASQFMEVNICNANPGFGNEVHGPALEDKSEALKSGGRDLAAYVIAGGFLRLSEPGTHCAVLDGNSLNGV